MSQPSGATIGWSGPGGAARCGARAGGAGHAGGWRYCCRSPRACGERAARADLEPLRQEIEALVDPDVASIFKLLQRAGVSQRHVARLTGQSQSEIHEILASRNVKHVDVLAKIADGLGMPRRVFGLADDAPDGPITIRVVVDGGPALQPPQPVRPMVVHVPLPRQRPAVGPSPTPRATQAPHATPLPTGEANGFRLREAPDGTDLTVPVLVSSGSVISWTGREVRLLREARRMSVREFAAHLGVSDRMVSKWEAGGTNIQPRPLNQAALDTSLRLAAQEAQERFNAALTYAATLIATVMVTPEPSDHDGPNSEMQRWTVLVPMLVSGREGAVVMAERITTALRWLPGVEVEGVRLTPPMTSAPQSATRPATGVHLGR